MRSVCRLCQTRTPYAGPDGTRADVCHSCDPRAYVVSPEPFEWAVARTAASGGAELRIDRTPAPKPAGKVCTHDLACPCRTYGNDGAEWLGARGVLARGSRHAEVRAWVASLSPQDRQWYYGGCRTDRGPCQSVYLVDPLPVEDSKNDDERFLLEPDSSHPGSPLDPDEPNHPNAPDETCPCPEDEQEPAAYSYVSDVLETASRIAPRGPDPTGDTAALRVDAYLSLAAWYEDRPSWADPWMWLFRPWPEEYASQLAETLSFARWRLDDGKDKRRRAKPLLPLRPAGRGQPKAEVQAVGQRIEWAGSRLMASVLLAERINEIRTNGQEPDLADVKPIADWAMAQHTRIRQEPRSRAAIDGLPEKWREILTGIPE